MADQISFQNWLEPGNCQLFSPKEEELFSNLDLSLSIGYKPITNPFKNFQSHSLFSSLDNNLVNPISTNDKTEAISNSQDVLNGTRNENTSNYNNQVEPIRNEISRVNSIGDSIMHDENNKVKEIKRQKIRTCLSKESISRYFHMPIDEAVKELNVGLTFLKKRCRELGIPRWPYRKLTSLNTIETNVKGLWKMDGEMSRSKLKKALETLEMEKKMFENDPGLKFGDNTKKLRQACYNANYHKRKRLMSSTSSTSSIS